MRTILSFLIFILICLIIGCNRLDNPIVAKAFHHNLYQSDLLKKIPYATSKEDSLLFMEQYVNDWVLKQTLIAYAKKELTQKEQDFDSQMKLYKEQLLINAFMQKITKDSSLFAVSLSEIIPSEINEAPEYREMVKLNYIKLSEPSKLYQKIKYLFFFEKDRIKATKQLELICADTMEYYLENEHWFYTDLVEKELPFSFSNKENIDVKDKFDFVQDGSRYLVLILDRKKQPQRKNILEDKKMQQLLLQQQKKVSFVNSYKDSLVQKALLEKKVVVYPKLY